MEQKETYSLINFGIVKVMQILANKKENMCIYIFIPSENIQIY